MGNNSRIGSYFILKIIFSVWTKIWRINDFRNLYQIIHITWYYNLFSTKKLLNWSPELRQVLYFKNIVFVSNKTKFYTGLQNRDQFWISKISISHSRPLSLFIFWTVHITNHMHISHLYLHSHVHFIFTFTCTFHIYIYIHIHIHIHIYIYIHIHIYIHMHISLSLFICFNFTFHTTFTFAFLK